MSTSTAHLLGLGGYFLVKSVSYNINGSKDPTSDFEFNCEAKFIGTDGDQLVKKDEKTIREIIAAETDEKCITAHDNAVQQNQIASAAYNSNASEDEQVTNDFTEINPSATTPAATTTPPAAESEPTPVPVVEPTVTPYVIQKSFSNFGNKGDEVIEINFKGPKGTTLGARWTKDLNSGKYVFGGYTVGGIEDAKVIKVDGVPTEAD